MREVPQNILDVIACWHLFSITVGNQLFVEKARQDMYERRRRRRWMSLDIVVLGGGGGGGGE